MPWKTAFVRIGEHAELIQTCQSKVVVKTSVLLVPPINAGGTLLQDDKYHGCEASHSQSFLWNVCRQEGLGQIASKFGTSPEELLKEEKTWANGVQQVCNILGNQICLTLQGGNVIVKHPPRICSTPFLRNCVPSGAGTPAGRASGHTQQAVLRGERRHPAAVGCNDNLA